MPIYFISDLHLSESHPELTGLFLRFMQGKALQAQAVYILGDLFDFWVGDDEVSPLNEAVKQALSRLANKGIPVYFVCGNRDFLIGRRFAEASGMTLLPDYAVAEAFGKKILVCHGDTLCIDDVRYQKFRRIVHWKWLQKLFLMLPLSLRVRIAQNIRAGSGKDKQRKAAAIMDVNPQFTAETVHRHDVALLIHGHTHREHIHHEQGFTRIVLGDWHDDYASVLELDEAGFRFTGV